MEPPETYADTTATKATPSALKTKNSHIQGVFACFLKKRGSARGGPRFSKRRGSTLGSPVSFTIFGRARRLFSGALGSLVLVFAPMMVVFRLGHFVFCSLPPWGALAALYEDADVPTALLRFEWLAVVWVRRGWVGEECGRAVGGKGQSARQTPVGRKEGRI